MNARNHDCELMAEAVGAGVAPRGQPLGRDLRV
jgi:hypothetical protein